MIDLETIITFWEWLGILLFAAILILTIINICIKVFSPVKKKINVEGVILATVIFAFINMPFFMFKYYLFKGNSLNDLWYLSKPFVLNPFFMMIISCCFYVCDIMMNNYKNKK